VLFQKLCGNDDQDVWTLNKALQAVRMDTGSWEQEVFKFLRHDIAIPYATTGMSPSELLNNRKLKTELPCRVKRKCWDFMMMSYWQSERQRSQRVPGTLMKELADNERNVRLSNIGVGDMVQARQPKTNCQTLLTQIHTRLHKQRAQWWQLREGTS